MSDQQTRTERARIAATLERINNNYGRGDIIAIDFNANIVTVKKQYNTEHPRYYFTADNKIEFRGVVRSLNYGGGNAARCELAERKFNL